MKDMLIKRQTELVNHPIYSELNNIDSLRVFMESHIFAVWDFMSLLKGLQGKIAHYDLPWRPSPYGTDTVRLINDIVLSEESDLDQNGNPVSHFEMYLNAMDEVGAKTEPILSFLDDFSFAKLPQAVREFVSFHLDLALNGKIEEIAGAFFFGREKLLPELFQQIVDVLESSNLECPTLIYYFKRHIELDGDEHGPMALRCLDQICGDDMAKRMLAHNAALQSLKLREKLWDETLKTARPQLYFN